MSSKARVSQSGSSVAAASVYPVSAIAQSTPRAFAAGAILSYHCFISVHPDVGWLASP